MDDRFSQTKKISQNIQSYGYTLIELWEHDFDAEMQRNEEMRNFINSQDHLRVGPLDPRDAFFGGRTETTVRAVTGKK